MDGPFRKRLRRRLYYGDTANMDTPSLPMTELTVDYFKDAVSQKLGHVGVDTASDLIKRNGVSPCSMVLSMMYAKRLKQKNQDYLCSMSSSDVFFISMMMASKYLYDEGVEEEVFNDEWADNTDQDIDDVNEMEVDFLKAIDWHLFVRPEEFEDTLAAIERRLALQEGLKRGWFTYSELAVLADLNLMTGLWSQVGLECSKLTTVLSAAYVTSLLSLLGSTALAFQLAGPLSTATVALLTLNVSPGVVPAISPPPYDPASPTEKTNCTLSGPNPVSADVEAEMSDILTEAPDSRARQVACVSSSAGIKGKENMSEPDRSTTPSAGSSLWSLLFLDSLLTQLWSVGSNRQSGPADQQARLLHHQRRRLGRNPPLDPTSEDGLGNSAHDSTNDGIGFSVDDPRISHPSGLSHDDGLRSNDVEKGSKSAPEMKAKSWISTLLHGPADSHESVPSSLDHLNPCHQQTNPEESNPDPRERSLPLLNEKAANYLLSPLLSMVHVTPGFYTSIPYTLEAT